MPSGDHDDDALSRFTGPNTQPVFRVTHDGRALRLVPRFSRGRTRWAVQVRSRDGESILFESHDGLTERAREEYDVPASLHERIEAARATLDRNLELFPVQGNREEVVFSLSELEATMDDVAE
ncbi:MAG: hypothetical protein ABEJ28_10890 [Salinigranum sp.]